MGPYPFGRTLWRTGVQYATNLGKYRTGGPFGTVSDQSAILLANSPSTFSVRGTFSRRCSSGQGSEALIGSLHIQALPINRQKTRTCCCTCSCYKILCRNMPSDKNFLRKRACVRPRFKEHCAGCRDAGRQGRVAANGQAQGLNWLRQGLTFS